MDKESLLKEIRGIQCDEIEGPLSHDAICGFINGTPSLLSLLYDIDLMPEQASSHPDKSERERMWRDASLITVAWCLRDDELTKTLDN